MSGFDQGTIRSVAGLHITTNTYTYVLNVAVTGAEGRGGTPGRSPDI